MNCPRCGADSLLTPILPRGIALTVAVVATALAVAALAGWLPQVAANISASPIDGILSPKPLTLDPTPARYPRTADNVLHPYDPARWRGLSSEHTSASREAAEDLVRRIRDVAEVFAAGSKHVPLYTGSDATVESFRKSPIQAWLPGYSTDRRLAIVTLAIPWSIHSCSATYVLTRGEARWEVRVRDFVCYM